MGNSLQWHYGFYPTIEPFWVGEALSSDSWRYELMDEIETVVLEHTNNDYALYVRRDGMFVVSIQSVEQQAQGAENDEEKYYSKLGKYTNYINCIVLLFESTLAELENEVKFHSQELTTKEIATLEYRDGGFSLVKFPSYSTVEARSLCGVDSFSEASLNLGLLDRPVLEFKLFDKFFEHVDQVLDNCTTVQLIAQLMKSLSEYRIADKETSLILSWFIIEVFLQKKWRQWLSEKNQTYDDNSKRINSDRFDNFKKGRDYPISVVSNFLELSNVISFDLFKNINYIRGLRNDIVHQNENRECTYADCQLALQIASEFMNEDVGFPLNLNLAFPMYNW